MDGLELFPLYAVVDAATAGGGGGGELLTECRGVDGGPEGWSPGGGCKYSQMLSFSTEFNGC